MPETTQQPARDWQEDWKRLNGIRSIHTVNEFLRAQRYWMQEYREKEKELIYFKAKHNCDYHSLQSKFQRLREEYAAEKKRADSLLDLVQKVSEKISWKNQGDGIDRALKMIYKWCDENPVNVVKPDESNR